MESPSRRKHSADGFDKQIFFFSVGRTVHANNISLSFNVVIKLWSLILGVYCISPEMQSEMVVERLAGELSLYSINLSTDAYTVATTTPPPYCYTRNHCANLC